MATTSVKTGQVWCRKDRPTMTAIIHKVNEDYPKELYVYYCFDKSGVVYTEPLPRWLERWKPQDLHPGSDSGTLNSIS